MLSAEENELLTRVGPGTAMGELLRRFWVPALLCEEVSEPDGSPVEVRLMGEDLVAFRDSEGRVGLLDRFCPHRRTALSYGRNEEGGLRCIYHGWKFGVDGACLDMPTAPVGSSAAAQLRAGAYPVHEAGGIVWAYLGPREHEPPFPDFDWVRAWPEHSKEWKVLEECNYAQAIEGGIDSAHVGFLHRRRSQVAGNLNIRRTAPALQIQYTNYGFRYAALRDADGERQYIRVTPYIAPWTTVVPPGNVGFAEGGVRTVNLWVPRDDYSTWHYQYLYDFDAPLDVEGRTEEGGLWVDEDYHKLRNKENRYLQDQHEMKYGEHYTGILGIVTQDHMANEAQTPIVDRSSEHIGTSDVAVVAMRRLLLGAARQLRDGQLPGILEASDLEGVTSQSTMTEKGVDWKDVCPIAPDLVL